MAIITGGGEVSEAEFQKFLDREITPRFPDGLTVYEADGQFLDSTGTLIRPIHFRYDRF